MARVRRRRSCGAGRGRRISGGEAQVWFGPEKGWEAMCGVRRFFSAFGEARAKGRVGWMIEAPEGIKAKIAARVRGGGAWRRETHEPARNRAARF